jgi:hypothetical protein
LGNGEHSNVFSGSTNRDKYSDNDNKRVLKRYILKKEKALSLFP